ncbi:hypothetical protein ACQCVH_17520 [Bacillus infantis]|uniref:hypothetical protein n=1 Tax=Bacillus infantis TaxID=324767 RepID=UPI003CF6B56D
MKEKHSESKETAPDSLYESRGTTYQDIERMIGEGLSGGVCSRRQQFLQYRTGTSPGE